LAELGLQKEAVLATAASPAARTRLIYSGGRMHVLPSSLGALLWRRPPIIAGALRAVLREPWVPPRRPAERDGADDDESIHAFVSRRFSPGRAFFL
jgi:protoporphyrinogen oxidase